LLCYYSSIHRKLLPLPTVSNVFPTLSSSSFTVSDLTIRSLKYFNLKLVPHERDLDLVSHSHSCISSFLSTSYWSNCLFSMFMAPLSKIKWPYVHEFVSGSSVPLVFMSVLMLELWGFYYSLYSIVWSQVLWYVSDGSLCSRLLWISEVFWPF
jgi:hypothetical protein